MVLIDTFNRGGGESSPYGLEGHTADVGTAWTRVAGTANSIVLSPNGQVRPNVANGATPYVYTNAYAYVTSSNYETQADVVWYGTANGRGQSIVRWNGSTGIAGGFLSGSLEILLAVSPYTSYAAMSISSFMTSGRTYSLIFGCTAQVFYVAVYDTVVGRWLTSSGFDSTLFTQALSVSIPSAPSAGSSVGLLFYAGSVSDTLNFPIQSLSVQPNTTVPSPPTTIAVTDPCISFSPYNWRVSGGAAESINPGAYVKINFTGSVLAVNIDDTKLSGLAVTPVIQAIVDGVRQAAVTLASGVSQVFVAGGLSSGSHSAILYFKEAYAGNQSVNRWNTGGSQNMVRILSFAADAAGSAIAPATKKALIYGDSITEGLALTASTHDSRQCYATHLGVALNTEYGTVGFGSQGWDRAGAYNTPAFRSAWNLYYSGQSRLTGGLLSPAPDYIIIAHGTNDGLNSYTPSTLRGYIQTTLTAIRTAAPSAYLIVLNPFGGFIRSDLLAAFNAYIAASGDTKAYLVDLGSDGQIGITAFALGASDYSSDGIHPTPFNHGRLAGLLAARINSIAPAESPSSGRSRLRSIVPRVGSR